MPVIDNTPQLTIYRNGLANLNGEATRLLSDHKAMLLVPPAAARPLWQLRAPVPGLEGLADQVRLVGRADRDHLRFRYPALALALFAALPPARRSLRLALQPVPGNGWSLVAQ